ncbi:MAG TPA: amidohydrolase family protein [Dermatophilaceae bacterium]|nr:amidohydrolase family protein [Dermatophilaceae bacterium]
MTFASADPTSAGGEAAGIAAFRKRHDLPGLVDVHTHFMPDRVQQKVWEYFDAAGPLVGQAWPAAYRFDQTTRLRLLRDFGVRVFTALAYPHRPGMAAWLSDWTLGFAVATPGCVPSATFFAEPGAGDHVAAAVRRGAQVFKCHVQVGGFDPTDDTLDDAWGVLAEAGAPVVIHCGSGPAPGRHTGLAPIRAVLRRHPQLRLIVAHMGMPDYEAFLDLAEEFPGVCLDTAVVFTDFVERMAPFPRTALTRLAGQADRILLGTDYPSTPGDYLHQLEVLERLDLGTDWVQQVCWHNGLRVLGIDEVPLVPTVSGDLAT